MRRWRRHRRHHFHRQAIRAAHLHVRTDLEQRAPKILGANARHAALHRCGQARQQPLCRLTTDAEYALQTRNRRLVARLEAGHDDIECIGPFDHRTQKANDAAAR
jgi:hypothetical protein